MSSITPVNLDRATFVWSLIWAMLTTEMNSKPTAQTADDVISTLRDIIDRNRWSDTVVFGPIDDGAKATPNELAKSKPKGSC